MWRKTDGPPQLARHGLSAAAYQKAFTENAKAGWRLVDITGYEIAGTDRYAAIWERRSGPPLVARHGLSAAKYQATFDILTKQGYRLLDVSGYTRGGSPRYAAIFEKSSGPAWVSFHAMTAGAYQANYTKYVKDGYSLRTVSGYDVGGKARFAALWEKRSGPVARVRSAVPVSSYQRQFQSDRLEGYVLTGVQAFALGNSVRVNSIWESALRPQDLAALRDAAQGFLVKSGVAGLSVAIAKDGHLLYASGFGLADRVAKTKMDAFHRLRIGSISKTVTAVAIYKLIEEGRLTAPANSPSTPPSGVDRRVLGPGGLLPDITVPASMKALEQATVGQFLAHLTGLPGQNASSESNQFALALQDPVSCVDAKGKKRNLPARIAAELARHAQASKDAGKPPMMANPGERYDYENLDHNIAEALIERLSGMSYSTYVRTRVFAPSALSAPRLFTIGDFVPSSGEAMHYEADGKTYATYPANKTCDRKPPGTGAGGWAMSARAPPALLRQRRRAPRTGDRHPRAPCRDGRAAHVDERTDVELRKDLDARYLGLGRKTPRVSRPISAGQQRRAERRILGPVRTRQRIQPRGHRQPVLLRLVPVVRIGRRRAAHTRHRGDRLAEPGPLLGERG